MYFPTQNFLKRIISIEYLCLAYHQCSTSEVTARANEQREETCAVLEAPFSGKGLCSLAHPSVTVILSVPGPELGSGGTETILNWRRTICEEDSPNEKVLTDCSEPNCIVFVVPSPLLPLPQPPTQYKLHDSTKLIWLVFRYLHNVQTMSETQKVPKKYLLNDYVYEH